MRYLVQKPLNERIMVHMNILFVMPHPDDEAFAVSGTIKRLTTDGHRVILIVVTDGSAGKNSLSRHLESPRSGVGDLTLAAIRKSEVEKSAEILKISETYFLNYVDATLADRDIRKRGLVDKIGEVIKKEKPEIVVTYDHTGVYWHIDHVVTSLATTIACKEQHEIVDKLFFFVPPKDFSIRLGYSSAARFPMTHMVSITSVADCKRQCIDIHKSQAHDKEKFLKSLGQTAFEREDYYLEINHNKTTTIDSIFKPISK